MTALSEYISSVMEMGESFDSRTHITAYQATAHLWVKVQHQGQQRKEHQREIYGMMHTQLTRHLDDKAYGELRCKINQLERYVRDSGSYDAEVHDIFNHIRHLIND